MNLRIFDDLEALSQSAAVAILESGAKSIAVTGGSTPKRLYEILAPQLPKDVWWILGDERYVPHDDPQSNAAMIERTLFAHERPERWLPFDTTFADAEESARAFERGFPVDAIGLVLLGCGDDGHTASLFPGTPILEVRERIAAAVFVPRLQQWRVTLTLPVIRAAKMRFVLASGASKAPIVRDVRAGVDHPVARATTGVDAWWFVDRAAAG